MKTLCTVAFVVNVSEDLLPELVQAMETAIADNITLALAKHETSLEDLDDLFELYGVAVLPLRSNT